MDQQDQPPKETIYKTPPAGLVAEAKKSWLASHTIFLIVLALVVAVAGGAVYYYWHSTVPDVDQTPFPTHQEKPDPTANWNIYTNREYGFEFKYPSDWIVSTTKPDDREITIFSASNFETQLTTASKRITGTTLVSWKQDSPNGIFRNIKVGDKVGLEHDASVCQTSCKYEVIFRTDDFFSKGIFFDLYIPLDASITSDYLFSNLPKIYPKYKEIVYLNEQVLSTFKFLDSVFCGGIAGFPCPTTGFTCVSQGDYPDAGTNCTRKND